MAAFSKNGQQQGQLRDLEDQIEKDSQTLEENYGYQPTQGGGYPAARAQGGGFPAPQGGGFPASQGGQPGYGPPHAPYGTPPQGGYVAPQGGYGPPQGAFNGPPPGNPYGPPAVTNQPTGYGGPQQVGEWMRMPQQTIPNCPPGLEYLTMIDNLLVHQKVELMQVISGMETENQYTVHNSLGQKVYYAKEVSQSSSRSFWGKLRPFELKILDNFGTQVMNIRRPLACQYCCFPCCLQSIEVSAPPGNVVGLVEQEWSILNPKFVIKSPGGDAILRIQGPMCTMTCCTDADFKVLSADGTNQVGKISKQWAGYAKEAYTVADNFGISFPMDLDVRMKAVMLGACFLIDMMYYEQSPTQNTDKAGQHPQNQTQHQPI